MFEPIPARLDTGLEKFTPLRTVQAKDAFNWLAAAK
jgi:hypothetical protein